MLVLRGLALYILVFFEFNVVIFGTIPSLWLKYSLIDLIVIPPCTVEGKAVNKDIPVLSGDIAG